MACPAIVAAPQQLPDWSGQLTNLTSAGGGNNPIPGGFGDGVTGLPAGPGDITWPGPGGIASFADLQNQTQQLPGGGGFNSGFLDQFQNQTIPSPPDVSAFQGFLPGGTSETTESAGDA